MKAYLVLETGEVYQGIWNGGKSRAGEVVFNTSHSGYEEIATDPSYFSQIVVMTAPMQGNYSVDDRVWESEQVWIEGFISLQIQNSSRDKHWLERLTAKGIPLVSELDTRNLVLRLRDQGTPWGALVCATSENEAKIEAQKLIQEKKKIAKDWVFLTSRKQAQIRQGQMPLGPKVAVLDFGSKENILRQVDLWSSEVKVFNSRASAAEIMQYNPQALILTNGPGDPADVQIAPDTIRELLGRIPMFGICMGHQILALALGAQTYKMKFGHRGSNHPIKDDLLGKIYVTSQNHGYAIKKETLPVDVSVSQINLNDQTVAGIYSLQKKCLGIQYHPEACPGPHEGQELFKYFFERML